MADPATLAENTVRPFPTTRKRPYRSPPVHTLKTLPANVTRLPKQPSQARGVQLVGPSGRLLPLLHKWDRRELPGETGVALDEAADRLTTEVDRGGDVEAALREWEAAALKAIIAKPTGSTFQRVQDARKRLAIAATLCGCRSSDVFSEQFSTYSLGERALALLDHHLFQMLSGLRKP